MFIQLNIVLDLSEVWALLIPLGVLFFNRNQPAALTPVIIYLFLAFLLNIIADSIMLYNSGKELKDMISNNPYYNFHSIIRFVCFCIFFLRLRQSYFSNVKKLIPVVWVLFFVINFALIETTGFFNFLHLSGNLLSAEAYLLLVYCMLYYLSQLRDDVEAFKSEKVFWVITGLAIYVVINFFIFLFYIPMLDENIDLATSMWDIHNLAYIILCILIAKAFYVPVSN